MVGETTSLKYPVEALPLAGVRVLDFTGSLGVYCGKLLADVGCDVIKVELPRGDDLRRRPPFRDSAPPGADGLLFAYYNNNKRGITLDWTREEALPLLEELSAVADVVLISPDRRRPIAGLEDSPPYLSWLPMRTLLCSITPYGLTGPWRGWRATSFTSFASSGGMHPVGPDAGPPLAMPGQQLYDLTGVRAAILIVAALAGDSRSRSQTIDIAAHDLGAWQRLVIERYSLIGRITTRETNFGPPPGGVWECRDGFIDIAAHSARHWDMFVELLGSPEDLSEPLYRDRAMRAQLFDMLTTMIEHHIRDMSAHELVERGQALGLPCALMYRPEEFLDDLQPRERGTFVDIEHSLLGLLRMPGPAVHSSNKLLSYRRPAPTLGESNRDVYVEELGRSVDELREWSTRGLV